MADVDQLFGEIRRSIKGCPEPTMQDALVRAARAFCKDTWLLRRAMSLTCDPLQEDPRTYPLAPPPNEEVLAIKHGQIGEPAPGAAVRPLRFVYPTLMNPNLGPRQPFGLAFVPYRAVTLYPAPDQAYPVTLELVTQPMVDTAQLPDELAAALGYGALMWLYGMSGTQWYSPEGVMACKALFDQEVVQGRIRAAMDFTPNQQQWIQRGFAWRR